MIPELAIILVCAAKHGCIIEFSYCRTPSLHTLVIAHFKSNTLSSLSRSKSLLNLCRSSLLYLNGCITVLYLLLSSCASSYAAICCFASNFCSMFTADTILYIYTVAPVHIHSIF
jgi:hypothetical protein